MGGHPAAGSICAPEYPVQQHQRGGGRQVAGRGFVPPSVQPDVCQASLPAPPSVHSSHSFGKSPPASLGRWAAAVAGRSLTGLSVPF